jgi:hypothetical protein
MEIKTHHINDQKIAEVTADGLIIATIGDGTDLIGNLYYQDFDKAIIYEKNITPDFFDLKTGIAGEILQKFSTYRMRLAIVGDFSQYPGKSLKDFIFESNKIGRINFLGTMAEALDRLSNTQR